MLAEAIKLRDENKKLIQTLIDTDTIKKYVGDVYLRLGYSSKDSFKTSLISRLHHQFNKYSYNEKNLKKEAIINKTIKEFMMLNNIKNGDFRIKYKLAMYGYELDVNTSDFLLNKKREELIDIEPYEIYNDVIILKSYSYRKKDADNEVKQRLKIIEEIINSKG